MRGRDARQHPDVLVDQENRLPGRLDPLDAAPDLQPHHRRQPLRGLVQDEQPRVRHQRPSDRQHLLLASRQRTAEGTRARRELREEREDLVGRPRVG